MTRLVQIGKIKRIYIGEKSLKGMILILLTIFLCQLLGGKNVKHSNLISRFCQDHYRENYIRKGN